LLSDHPSSNVVVLLDGGKSDDAVYGGSPSGSVGDRHAEQVAKGADVAAGGLDFW